MSQNHKDHDKRRNEHPLKALPTEVLLKARSTLLSFGALKSKDRQKKQDIKHKKNERLKSSRSEPEFNETRKVKHRSRDEAPRTYVGIRPRPLSVGATKRYEDDINYNSVSVPKEPSPLQRRFDSADEMYVKSRLVLPVIDKVQDVQMHEPNERPRKKLSFREPEIVGSGSATLGRSSKLMGVNSLTRRNRISIRNEPNSTLEGIDLDLESQAMRIVRTVGQAFDVCHKMQTPDQPVPSTSSAADEPVSVHASEPGTSKAAASECASQSAPSTSKDIEEPRFVPRPKTLDLLPPSPKKESKRAPQAAVPNINLSDLPECITKVEISPMPEDEPVTPLTAQHHLQLLKERLEQQAQQTRAAVAQLVLLRDQLAAEQTARCEAQARTHQLLIHNKELLEHIAALVAQLQEKEKGSTRPINAQQLTLIPQAAGGNDANKSEALSMCNGDSPNNDGILFNYIAQTMNMDNAENDNMRSTYCLTPPSTEKRAGPSSAPNFGTMSNDQIQNYLISKFQDMKFTKDAEMNEHQFYQNRNAFPNIPPLTSHYSNSDISSLLNHNVYNLSSKSSDEMGAMAQAMNYGLSEASLYSTSQTTSKDSSPDALSSDDGIAFIMPLSHNGTLAATGDDGRVRLIVPVSPSESSSDVGEIQPNVKEPAGDTLKVPGAEASGAPITRTTSEKVPNKSEMMTALRSQWTRHTTK